MVDPKSLETTAEVVEQSGMNLTLKHYPCHETEMTGIEIDMTIFSLALLIKQS